MEMKGIELGYYTRRILGWAILGMFVITLASMLMDFERNYHERERAQALEMSKRGYCLKATAGTDQLTYQPCNVVGRDQ